MRQVTYKNIAMELEKQVRANPERELPTLKVLAEEFGVARQTMWKAARFLVSKGILTAGRGHRLSVSNALLSQKGLQQPKTQRAEDRFFSYLRERIVDGSYRAGEALPKRDFFTVGQGVSPSTVSLAMRRLEAEELIYKKGRSWVVGKPWVKRGGVKHGWEKTPTVLLIAPGLSVPGGIFTSDHTGPFYSSLGTELRRFGFRAHFVSRELAGLAQGHVPDSGKQMKEARALVHRLGHQYSGTVIQPGTRSDILREWYSRLSEFYRPVIFFDSTGNLVDFSRKDVVIPRQFYRFCHSENQAVEVLFDQVRTFGHTRVGVPNILGGTVAWANDRIELMKKTAREMYPEITLYTVNQSETFWQFTREWRLSDEYRRRYQGQPLNLAEQTSTSSARRYLLEQTPSFKYLLDRDVSIVVGLNNAIAFEYLQWFRVAGFSVPKDISLVSFGNTPASMALPISTVDFGFERLGYLAAHKLIGDVPVNAGRTGSVSGQCSFVDRGSLKH